MRSLGVMVARVSSNELSEMALIEQKVQTSYRGLLQGLISFAVRSSVELAQGIAGQQYFNRETFLYIYFFHREYTRHHPQGEISCRTIGM